MSKQDEALAAAQAQDTVIEGVIAMLTELRNDADPKTQATIDQILANTAKLTKVLTTTPSGDPAPIV